MKILVTGDFHGQKNNVEELKPIFTQILKHLKYCQRIVLLGDIFNNSNPSPAIVKAIISFIKSIPKEKTIYVIGGNHDLSREEYATCWIPLIHSNVIYNEKGIKTTINGKTVNMMHIHVNESKLGPEDIKLNSVSYKKFKEDILLLGHVHKPQIISESPLVLHPGSPHYINFGERNDKKGIYILDIQDKITYTFVPLNVIPMKQIEVNEKNLDEIEVQLEELSENTKLKVVFNIDSYKPEIINKIGKMLKKYRNKFYSFKHVLNIQRQKIEVSQEEKCKTINQLLDEFCTKEKTDDEIKNLLKELLQYEN